MALALTLASIGGRKFTFNSINPSTVAILYFLPAVPPNLNAFFMLLLPKSAAPLPLLSQI
jgi:hypothetical protein